MRLLAKMKNGEFGLTGDLHDDDIPRYAILSHTWGLDTEEVTFEDLLNGTRSGRDKPGYNKIRFCGEQARRDGLQYFWVDTCCINKSSSTELSEAINSMFQWYRNADKCYVYLSDVSRLVFDSNDQLNQLHPKSEFRKSRWFTRGWTLQELLAPALVEFFSKDWKPLGDKKSLERYINEITGVPIKALQGSPLSDFDINERISWAETRETTRKEDNAYSLLGIFDIHMPLIYGEGRVKAFKRLHKEIDEASNVPFHPLPYAAQVPFNSSGKQHARASQSLSEMAKHCQPCARSFNSEQALQQHLNSSAHFFECEKCTRSFNSQQALNQHLSSSAHPRIFGCSKCDWIFGSQQSLDQHLNSSAHPPVYKCDECDRYFGSQHALNQHLNSSAHNFECDECKRSFGSRQSLEQHLVSPRHNF